MFANYKDYMVMIKWGFVLIIQTKIWPIMNPSLSMSDELCMPAAADSKQHARLGDTQSERVKKEKE